MLLRLKYSSNDYCNMLKLFISRRIQVIVLFKKAKGFLYMNFNNVAVNLSLLSKTVFDKTNDLDLLADEVALSLMDFEQSLCKETQIARDDAKIISQLSTYILKDLDIDRENF